MFSYRDNELNILEFRAFRARENKIRERSRTQRSAHREDELLIR